MGYGVVTCAINATPDVCSEAGDDIPEKEIKRIKEVLGHDRTK